MTTTTELQQYLHEHIPLSAAMGVTVLQVSPERVLLAAPLDRNINHRQTVFGGSASAVAILAAWSLVQVRLQQQKLSCRLVIQSNTMAYDRPISGDFTAEAALPPAGSWQAFERLLQRRGKARITVMSVLLFEGLTAGRFSGEFVALSASHSTGLSARD
ncbi:MAG: YiiD C-terminal domain-containing protein [Pseudomonadota bacterium]